MGDRLDAYASGDVSLLKLAEDLRGLFDACDPRDLSIRDSFYDLWADLDAECELRTESWAPPGAADDVTQLIAAIRRAIRHVPGAAQVALASECFGVR